MGLSEAAHRARVFAQLRDGGTTIFDGFGGGSYEEEEAEMERQVRIFMKADADLDGALTIDEFLAAVDALFESNLELHPGDGMQEDMRPTGPMEARLWFASLDHEHQRQLVDLEQWLALVRGEHVPPDGSLRHAAIAAAKTASASTRHTADDAAMQRELIQTMELIESALGDSDGDDCGGGGGSGGGGGGDDDAGVGSSRSASSPIRPAFPQWGGESLDGSPKRTRTEEERAAEAREERRQYMHRSKIVGAGTTMRLSEEGRRLIEGLPDEDLGAALALFERHDADEDGLLTLEEYRGAMADLSRHRGARFSEAERDRLFRAADLRDRGKARGSLPEPLPPTPS